MSWQYIPAQLDVEYRNYFDSSEERYFGFKPGYFIGMGKEDGLFMVNAAGYSNLPSSMSGDWIITSKPFPQFTVSAMSSADTLIDEFEMYGATWDYGSSTSERSLVEPMLYFGKPVFYGEYSNYTMKYSPSENSYVIMDQAGQQLAEPIYSVNTLSGGLSGDHLWKSQLTSMLLNTGLVEFDLTGAAEQYKESVGENAIVKFLVSSDFDYYYYSSPAELSDLDEWPAGEYTNNKTGEQIIVGVKTYKGSDNSLWKGFQLKNTNQYGSFSAPYYKSSEHGQIRYYGHDNTWGTCWRTPGSASSMYIFNENATSALPPTFTLRKYVDSEGKGYYEPDPTGNIEMELGPYQLVSSDNTILMGEVSLWR